METPVSTCAACTSTSDPPWVTHTAPALSPWGESHFKNEGIFRLAPYRAMDLIFFPIIIIFDCPAHMYNGTARLEADTYALAISVQRTLDDSKPCDRPSIVAAHHNVSREPRICANGIPFTSAMHCIRMPGMKHNVGHVLKPI